MLDRLSKNVIGLFFLNALVFHTGSTFANNKNSFIEYTQSFDISTYESIKSIGFFARLDYRNQETIYGGLQFSLFEFSNNTESNSIFRVVIGATMGAALAPYIELSTDLLSALILSSNENNQDNCNDENRCRLDGFVRAGIRLEVINGVRLGLFHEVLSFGDNHTFLKGEHNQSGMSISIDY